MSVEQDIEKLTAAMSVAFDPVPVVGHPVDQVPGVPSVVLYPGAPFIEPDTFCNDVVRLQVVVYAARLSEQNALATAASSIDLVRPVLEAEGWSWTETNVSATDVGGITYLQAIHDIRKGGQ